MGEIVINKKNTTIDLFNYKPFRSVTKAELSRTLMSDDYVDISVECANPLDLSLGDRVMVEGRTFFLNMLPPAKKLAEDQFSYELRFEGPAFLLRKLKVFNLDSQGNKTTNEFPLTGEINEFLYLLINNANKKDNQWILGNFPSNTETKTLTFNNENCLAVLQRVCQEFNVEFDIVEAGGKFTLNIREKIGKTLPFTVEYGMGNGLYDLSRARANDSEVVTVLYSYGSSQNIPVDYRGYSPRLRMPVAVGDYISNQAAIDLFGYVEDVFTPDIKPTFKGIVSGIGSLANGVQEISVSNMDFDLKEKKPNGETKYWIAGTPPKISVTKGDLAGYDFEVLDYIHSTKTFKLKQFADDKGQKFPDDTTVFKFAAGDEFTLIDIMMPELYIINAEQKLYNETVKEYQKVSQNNVKYTLNVDPLFLQDKGEIGIGDLLPIKDADFGIDKASRIISLKKDLLTDTYTSFDVADSYEISLVKEIVNDIKDLQKEIASQKVINRQSYLDGYRRVEDRFSMYFDADGKMDGSHIKADTIDVGLLSSGAKSRWFQLEEVVFTTNLGSDPNSFKVSAGRLVHFGIKTSTGSERVWNLAALAVENLLNQGYYLYAKCEINGSFGTFIVTPDRIVFDSQPNYYHFLIGSLYSPSNGFRIFDANYGVSQVNGRQITAGEIASVNRRLIIDLDKGEIIGKVTFTNDSPALGQVQEKIDAVQIGGRNAYKKSTPIDPLNVDFQREHPDAPNGFYAVGRNNPDVNNIRLWGVISGNGEWTVSFEMRGTQSVVVGLDVDICDLGLQHFNTTNDNSWKKYSLTVNVTNYSAEVYNFVDFSKFEWAYYLIRNIKIEKGNKATDWTPAPEDIQSEITVAKQNAANAQNTANTAAQNAIDANKKLSDIANDNIVTPQEKPDTLKEWKQIEAERPKLIAQAGTYNINTDNYNNYYVALANYLTNTGVFLDMSVSTNVDGREFKNNFQNYYDVRQDLLKAISDAAKAYATGLVDNLQVGSRNLLLESSVQLSVPPGTYRIGGYLTSKLLEVGKTYTLMFKSGNGGRGSVGAWVNGFQHIGVNETDGGIKTLTFTVEDTGRELNIIDFYKVPSTDLDRWSAVNWAVLVEGNKMGLQSWLAAPEDLEKKITEAQNSANIATQKLADIANDNVLTVSEKPDVMKEWQVIDAEFTHIRSQAITYNVNYDNFSYFYLQLSSYLISVEYANLTKDNAINGAEFRQYFVTYYTERTDLLKRISDAAKNYTNVTTEAAKVEMEKDARNKALAASYISGNCLYRDVDFREGLNGLNVYNNLGNGAVELFNWAASSVNAPTKSPNIVICRYNGGGASPYLGGFYFGTQTRANAVFVVRLIMRLDVGYYISYHSNETGDNSTFDWVTPASGTGKWQEYIGILRCGATGTFNSSMFFAIAGANKVIETYIAYASVFDLTDVDKHLEDKIKQNEQQIAIAKAQADNALATANRVSQITSFLNTTVDGNVVASGTMLVGDVNGGNAGLTGVTDRGADSVRLFLGSSYANKNKAPLVMLDKGLIQMHHPNGMLGFEMGIVNGKLVFNVYDNSGNKTMEMGSQGIIFSNYIPDSWDNYLLLSIPAGSTNTDADLESFLRGQLIINTYQNDTYGWCNVDLNTNNNYWRYSAGVSYDSANYKQYEKFYYDTDNSKQKPGQSTPKKWDGWYAMPVHAQGSDAPIGGMSNWSITVLCIRLSGGEQVQTKNISMSGSEFIHP
ncbi:phage tail protein [Elizabethkingia miricola]|uniref:phage tail protein n=1 Tax=Elizabethkingia miricola TaxID=172045 RepID=UPI00099A23BD|nr:phage tail protein [Elizabethkingia miricola]OPC36140.1 hypothetical protein BAX99_18945 [Elizabethkingia miricola]